MEVRRVRSRVPGASRVVRVRWVAAGGREDVRSGVRVPVPRQVSAITPSSPPGSFAKANDLGSLSSPHLTRPLPNVRP